MGPLGFLMTTYLLLRPQDPPKESVNNFLKNQHFDGKFLCYISTGMWLNLLDHTDRQKNVFIHRQCQSAVRCQQSQAWKWLTPW